MNSIAPELPDTVSSGVSISPKVNAQLHPDKSEIFSEL